MFATLAGVTLAVTMMGTPGILPAGAGVPDSPRLIEVTLVAHPEVRARSAWRGTVKQALAEATEDWADLCGVRLAVTAESTWDPGIPGDLSETVAAWSARETAAPEAEPSRMFVLVMPGGEGPPDDVLGFALLARPVIAVRLADATRLKLTLRHELGHVFGLPHLPGRNVMAESFEKRSWVFEPMAGDVLRANRAIDFSGGDPFAGCDRDVLRDAYSVWAERGVGEAGLLRRLAISFRAAGRTADADACDAMAEHLSR